MALTDRQQARLRGALEAVFRADDAIAAIADERAHAGETDLDQALDRAAALLKELTVVLEPLAGGRTGHR
jgi:hypothetical protein